MTRRGQSVALHVEVASALDRPTDVVVLKHAQQLYGVDRAAVLRMGEPSLQELPAPGGHLVVRTPRNMPSSAVLFLGVPPLWDFTYRHIREFGDRALSIVALERLRVREICLTLHGPGFGLDEVEAFRSEVAGILDALRADRAGPELEHVVFLENDPRRAERMTAALAEMMSAGQRRDGPSAGARERSWQSVEDELGSVGFDSPSVRTSSWRCRSAARSTTSTTTASSAQCAELGCCASAWTSRRSPGTSSTG